VGQLKGLYLGLLVALVGIVLSWAPYGLDLEEQYGLRWLFWSRGIRPAPHEVLIIALDSRSAKRNDWPAKPDQWPRTRHAQLTEMLARSCARVIVYDLFFRAPRPAPEDDVFAHAIRSAGNVVLVGHPGIAEDERLPPAHQVDIQTIYFPVPALEEAAAAVTPFPLPNAPEGVTGFWAFKTSAGDSPTLPTVAFQLYALNMYEDLVHLLKKVVPQQASILQGEKGVRASTKGTTDLALHLREMFRTAPQTGRQLLAALDEVGDHDLAPAKKQTIRGLIDLYQGDDWRYLNFYGPPRSITTINYPAAIELAASAGKCNERNIFSEKVIFIGISETSPVEQKDKDIFDTVFSAPSGLKLSGVEIAATAVGNLMEDKPVRRLESLPSLCIVIDWGFLATIVWRSFVTSMAFVVSLAGTLIPIRNL
jgi:adenylate cyclase